MFSARKMVSKDFFAEFLDRKKLSNILKFEI